MIFPFPLNSSSFDGLFISGKSFFGILNSFAFFSKNLFDNLISYLIETFNCTFFNFFVTANDSVLDFFITANDAVLDFFVALNYFSAIFSFASTNLDIV